MSMEIGYPNGYTTEDLEEVSAQGSFHPALKAALRWLADDGHLTGVPKILNNMFGHVAISTAMNAPQSPQSTIAVHKLVEAKDAAIRAWLDSQSSTANFISSGSS
jgi:hypothetical protein